MNFLIRLKYVLIMGMLILIEIGPVPIVPMVGLFIVVFRPYWFKAAVDRLYAAHHEHDADHRKQ